MAGSGGCGAVNVLRGEHWNILPQTGDHWLRKDEGVGGDLATTFHWTTLSTLGWSFSEQGELGLRQLVKHRGRTQFQWNIFFVNKNACNVHKKVL